jgi:hypothetical protein
VHNNLVAAAGQAVKYGSRTMWSKNGAEREEHYVLTSRRGRGTGPSRSVIVALEEPPRVFTVLILSVRACMIAMEQGQTDHSKLDFSACWPMSEIKAQLPLKTS